MTILNPHEKYKHGFPPGSEHNAGSHNGDREKAGNIEQGGFAKSLIMMGIALVMTRTTRMMMVTRESVSQSVSVNNNLETLSNSGHFKTP